MKTLRICVLLPGALLLLSTSGLHAQGGDPAERVGIMDGNQVRTVFGNWGTIGQPDRYGHRGAWKNNNNGYLGDVSPLMGAEVKWQGKTWHSVVTCPTNRPTARQDWDPVTNKYWTWEPVTGYFNANQSKPAFSTDPYTWPPFWPDKMNDPQDPGWKGSWNGYFGKRINADLETYFVMDDQKDEQFNIATKNALGVAFVPDSTNPTRKGMALVTSVRGMQWAQFLAKDNIFWLYEITNTGTTDYSRAVFGMLVGTYVGVTSTENYAEYSDDWSFYDVNTNITYTADYGRVISNPLWVGPVGMVGYAFLESPGNPFDGIDNDGDADSSSVGLSAPQFIPSSFDSVTLNAGQRIVLINDDYTRTTYTIPSVDSVRVYTRGMYFWIKPGKTRVAEGNVVQVRLPNNTLVDQINPNVYDGVDNNFNGLIDENFYLHYRQIKRQADPTKPPLIDILRPVRYVDYLTGRGTSGLSMIDEKRNDLLDNNQNWVLTADDLGRDGIAGTGDHGEGDGQPTSGYASGGFDTGLPGEPHIDKTDVRESDQIGLTSFYYFTPANKVVLGDDEELWLNLRPGFFDVPSSIVNNKPMAGEDGDFIYGSGYFPLLSKTTERFSLALVFGGGRGGSVDDDVADLLRNKKTVQKIYDANYQFPQPPDKPTLTAVPGDRKVTLYWDRKSEESVDPVLQIKDFQGYKLYKSTNPDFSDVFKITDGSGSAQGYMPLKQFDLKDGVKGYFRPTNDELYQDIAGYAYYLGSDNGLLHSYVDEEVENGRRYYYALVAYDPGDAVAGILPSENRVSVTVTSTGEVIHDINVAYVTPNGKTAGYVPPDDGVALTHSTSFGTGTAQYRVLDAAAVTGHRYRVEFLDTAIDTVDNNKNKRVDAADSSEWDRKTSFYFVRDLDPVSETFMSQDTSVVHFQNEHLIESTVSVFTAQGAAVSPSAYVLDAARGTIRGRTVGSLPSGQYRVTYQYYPVYRSPNIQGTPFLPDSWDADAFDGVTLDFVNQWNVLPDTSAATGSRWAGKQGYPFSMAPLQTTVGYPPVAVNGYRHPANYSFIFSDHIVDTSYADPDLFPFATPVNFRIYNETDSVYVKFIFADNDFNAILSAFDEIVFLDVNPFGKRYYSWDIGFKPPNPLKPDSLITFTLGDTLVLRTKRPFRQGDQFVFTTVRPTVDAAVAGQELSRVRAVPNPYVTASEFEPPLNPAITSGRGERKVDFIHLPAGATVKIFTARGDHVVTLYHDGNIEDGSVSWNLKTSENLDIAYGVYFYVVESTAGKTTGKLAIIK